MRKCLYCGRFASTIDHIIPKSKGGGNEKENLTDSCQECNSLKSSDDFSVFRKIFNGKFPDRTFDFDDEYLLRQRTFRRLKKLAAEMALYASLYGIELSDLSKVEPLPLTEGRIKKLTGK